MSEVVRRAPTTTSQRARASTATTQNAAARHWSEEDLHKSKHLRNASDISTVTVTIQPGKKPFSSETSATTLVEQRRRSSSRTMQRDGGPRRRGDLSADKETKFEGRSLESLVDRLLQRPTSEADARFTNNFLCLYRKFSAPSQVIACILQKFEDMVHDRTTPYLIKLTEQLRTLAVLVHWIGEFPGDFAHPLTSIDLANFAKKLSATPEFAFSSRELMSELENLRPDEDTDWACSDRSRGRASTNASFSSIPSLKISLPSAAGETMLSPSQESMASSMTSTEELIGSQWSASTTKKPGSRHSESSSITSSLVDKDPAATGSTSNLIDPYDIAQRHASMILKPSRKPLTKNQWHEFLSFDDDTIAKELTRIDWVMFSAVRPRDLIRHINLSGRDREDCKGLEHIDRMIAHFNHVASWIGQMILIRDKPKHRGRMLEKCMSVAWKLRQMNNYNGVGAFVAGIGNVAINRLHQTKAQVNPVVLKNFMRLEILMSMTKGYFAYRLAWNNTTAEKIPFLPLHRHDLVVGEEASPTFVNADRTLVNWTKFDTMGKTLWDIQKSQKTSYPGLQRNPDIQRLIMEGRVGDDVDDMLWERSVVLEPPASTDSTRRRSGWLRESSSIKPPTRWRSGR